MEHCDPRLVRNTKAILRQEIEISGKFCCFDIKGVTEFAQVLSKILKVKMYINTCFWLQNILCKFTTQEKKIKGGFNQNPLLNVRFKDL